MIDTGYEILYSIAAYAGEAKYQASGQVVHKLYNVEFEFKI